MKRQENRMENEDDKVKYIASVAYMASLVTAVLEIMFGTIGWTVPEMAWIVGMASTLSSMDGWRCNRLGCSSDDDGKGVTIGWKGSVPVYALWTMLWIVGALLNALAIICVTAGTDDGTMFIYSLLPFGILMGNGLSDNGVASFSLDCMEAMPDTLSDIGDLKVTTLETTTKRRVATSIIQGFAKAVGCAVLPIARFLGLAGSVPWIVVLFPLVVTLFAYGYGDLWNATVPAEEIKRAMTDDESGETTILPSVESVHLLAISKVQIGFLGSAVILFLSIYLDIGNLTGIIPILVLMGVLFLSLFIHHVRVSKIYVNDVKATDGTKVNSMKLNESEDVKIIPFPKSGKPEPDTTPKPDGNSKPDKQ